MTSMPWNSESKIVAIKKILGNPLDESKKRLIATLTQEMHNRPSIQPFLWSPIRNLNCCTSAIMIPHVRIQCLLNWLSAIFILNISLYNVRERLSTSVSASPCSLHQLYRYVAQGHSRMQNCIIVHVDICDLINKVKSSVLFTFQITTKADLKVQIKSIRWI